MARYDQSRREQLARAQGFASYRQAREFRAAAADDLAGGPRASRLRSGVDVSGAGTAADGPPMRQSSLFGLVQRAAFVKGRGHEVSLSVQPDSLTLTGSTTTKNRNTSFGLTDMPTDEVTVSLEGERQEDGTWYGYAPTLGDLLDALGQQGGDTELALVSLVLATPGVEDADGVSTFHLTIPDYFGG